MSILCPGLTDTGILGGSSEDTVEFQRIDGAMDPLVYYLPFIWERLGMKIGDTINERSLNLDLFQGFEESVIDLYSAVRHGYLQRRQKMIRE